jgi:hypothetical protein
MRPAVGVSSAAAGERPRAALSRGPKAELGGGKLAAGGSSVPSPPSKTPGSVLDRIRGSLPKGRANARTVAALTDNPGCARRRVIDAAGVKAYELAERLGHPVTRGQSPFAIVTGTRFEARLKTGSDYKLLVEVLKPFVDLPVEGLQCRDLGRVKGTKLGVESLEERARLTDEVLSAIARGDADAPHLVDHPVLVFDLAGAPVYLEPDALAFRVGTKLELVEIKSYPVIDGQAASEKVSSTAGQAAVYLLAMRATLARLGFDPNLLSWSVILVASKNFGRTPVAHRIPLRKKTMALERVLRAVPKTSTLVASLPETFTLDVDPKKTGGAAERKALDQAVHQLPMLYVPECLASCDMARYCRQQAIIEDDPARLGRAARDSLAGVPTLSDALRVVRNPRQPTDARLADVAGALRDAYGALQRGRSLAPASCGLEEAERPRKGRASR